MHLWSWWWFRSQSKRETMMYYPTDPSEKYGVFAVRLEKYKAHFYTRGRKCFTCTSSYFPIKAQAVFLTVFFFFISCASGAFHSSTTPDQDCSVFAGLKFHDPPLLFDLEADPSEYYPLSLNNRPDLQEVLGRIRKVKEQFEGSMVFGESQISKGKDESLEPCCSPQCSPKPDCCHCWWDTCLHLWRDNAQFSTFILNIFKMFMVIHRWSGEAFLFIV